MGLCFKSETQWLGGTLVQMDCCHPSVFITGNKLKRSNYTDRTVLSNKTEEKKEGKWKEENEPNIALYICVSYIVGSRPTEAT